MSKKDPLYLCKQTDKPFCYGEFDEDNTTCTEDCLYSQDCQDEYLVETENRNVNVRQADGKPICFAEYYSPAGPSCLNKCFWKDRCEEATQININRPLPTETGIRTEKLNVIGSPWSPPTNNTYPLRTNQYITQVNGGNRRVLTNEQALKFYNQPLHENPLIVNQFGTESWFQRLIKEFIVHTGDAATKIASELISGIIRNAIWAPNIKKEEKDGK